MNLLRSGSIDFCSDIIRRAIWHDPGMGYWQATNFDQEVPVLRLEFATEGPFEPILIVDHMYQWFHLRSEFIVTRYSLHGERFGEEQWQRILENPVPLIVRIALIS